MCPKLSSLQAFGAEVIFISSFFGEVVALLGWKGGRRKVKLFASSQGVCFLTLRL